MVPATKTTSAMAVSTSALPTPSARISAATTMPASTGLRKLRLRFSADARRHAMSGPTPIRKRRARKIGILTKLKKGAPTLILTPRTASDRSGKTVPKKTVKAAATRNADSVASFYAVDATAYPPSAPIAVGQAAAREVWAAGFADSTYAISWTTVHAGVSKGGDLGYTAGTYQESYRGSDGNPVTVQGKYLCVWARQADGSWKATNDMWNADSR